MGRNKIAFDIDDTIVDLVSVLDTQFVEKGYGSILGREIFDMAEYLKVHRWTIDDACYWAYRNYHLIKFYPYVSDLMELLYQRTGEPIQFVTGRSFFFATETYNLLKREIEVPFQIAFCDGWDSDKSGFLKNYEFFYEDRLETAIDLADKDKIVFMPSKSYNYIEEVHYTNIEGNVTIDDLINMINHLTEE